VVKVFQFNKYDYMVKSAELVSIKQKVVIWSQIYILLNWFRFYFLYLMKGQWPHVYLSIFLSIGEGVDFRPQIDKSEKNILGTYPFTELKCFNYKLI